MKKIRYVDLNNNVFSITPTSIHYDPMKPKFSSSGEYDGGEEKELLLAETFFNEIVELTQAVIDDTSIHEEQRRMLTAMLFVDGQKWIIGRSVKLNDLNSYLKEIIN